MKFLKFFLFSLLLASPYVMAETEEQKSDTDTAPKAPENPPQRLPIFPPSLDGSESGRLGGINHQLNLLPPQPRSPFQSPSFSAYPFSSGGGASMGASPFQQQFSQFGSGMGMPYGAQQQQQQPQFGGASSFGGYGGGGAGASFGSMGAMGGGSGGGGYGYGMGGMGGAGGGAAGSFGRSGPGGPGGMGGAGAGGASSYFPRQSFAGTPSMVPNYGPQISPYSNPSVPSSYQGFFGGANGNFAQRNGGGGFFL